MSSRYCACSDIFSMTETLFPRISDYGLIGNSRSAALVSRHGSLDWCCLPRFDSLSVFGAVLDPRRGGRFAITPTGSYGSHLRYIDDTNILETLFDCEEGTATLTDCFT